MLIIFDTYIISSLRCDDVSEAALERVCSGTSFSAMKTGIAKYSPQWTEWTNKEFAFIRKGKVGGYKTLFRKDDEGQHVDRYRQLTKQIFSSYYGEEDSQSKKMSFLNRYEI